MPHLTSLRFFAALAVVLSHAPILQASQNPWASFLGKTLFAEGFSGVSFFYVLSGYILSKAYTQRMDDGSTTRMQYFALRLARIYPLHLLIALPLGYLAWNPQDSVSVFSTLANFLLIQAWIPRPDYFFSLNSVSWSLSVEMWFYVVFAFAVFWETRRIAILWAIGTTVIAAGVAYAYFNGLTRWSDPGGMRAIHYWSYINPMVRLPDFLLGMLIYRLRGSHDHGGQIGASMHQSLSVIALIGVMIAASHYNVIEVLRSQLLYMPLAAYLVWAFATTRGLPARLLSMRPLVLLGDASFALYLTHTLVMRVVAPVYERSSFFRGPSDLVAVVVIACVLVSVILYLGFEKPITKILRRSIAKASDASPQLT